MRNLLRPLLAASIAAPLVAQSFQPGDLYLYSAGYTGGSSSAGAIVKIDPHTGAHTMFVDLVTVSSTADTIAYDPFRDRMIFFGGLVPNHNEVYLADAAGNLTSLGLGVASGPGLGKFAPRGDGIIYFVGHHDPLNFSYFDAANQVHTLMDASGTTPFAFPFGAGAVGRMVHHAQTNSLVCAVFNNLAICPGGTNEAVNLHVLELSSDGSRVVLHTCFQYDVNPGQLGEVPVGLGPGPGGDLLLHVDDNSSATLPRMAVVRPALGDAVPFAWSQVPATSSGTYSQLLGRAIVHDSGADVLRAFAFGESGDGLVIATGTGSPGGHSEAASLIEIAPQAPGFGLSASPGSISVSAGGAQAWGIAFGATHAGEVHLVAGSMTGWTPATPYGGVAIPLVFDAYAVWTLAHQNGPILQSTFGVLDGAGAASASFVLPGGAVPTLVGTTAYHAALALSGAGAVTAATNPVAVTFTP